MASANKASKEYILLAACGTNEVLPTNPDLPADVFTACLTTPIKIALKWYVSALVHKWLSVVITARVKRVRIFLKANVFSDVDEYLIFCMNWSYPRLC